MKLSDETYRDVVDILMEFVVRWKPDWTRTFANKAYCDYFGLTMEEAIGKSFMPLVLEEDKQRIINKISRLTPENPYEIDEHKVVRPDGSIAWNEWIDRGIFDNEGTLIEIQSVGRDITARKEIEIALAESEEKYRLLFSTEQNAVVIVDADTRMIIDANDSALQLYGYSLEEMLKLKAMDISAEPEKTVESINQSAAGTIKDLYCYTLNHRSKDGTVFPVEITAGTFRLNKRKVISAVIRDITERKKAESEVINRVKELDMEIRDRKRWESALRDSEERFRSLVEQAGDAMFLIDPEGKFIDVNQRACDVLGYTRKELLDLSVLDIDPLYPKEKFDKLVINLKKNPPMTIEAIHKRKNGEMLPVEIRIGLINIRNNPYILSLARDITERKKFEEQLKSMSLKDELTYIYNRRGFFILTDQILSTARRQEKQLFMLYADIDYLKFINDLIGHEAGDRVILDTANILKETFRESDIVARIGGDEFVVFGMDDPEAHIRKLVSRLRENINIRNERADDPLTDISLSYGFLCYDPVEPYSIDELLATVDNLMYEEKRRKLRC